MNLKIFILIFLLIPSCSSIDKKYGGSDKNLIIPGISAEGYRLGDIIENSVSSSRFDQEKNVGEILGIEYFNKLKFDSILYSGNTSVLFLKDRKVITIAGLKSERRITSDAVLLSAGVDNFILNYGNTELLIISKGNHRAYIYKDTGIAIFNDNSDNTVDMYLIFKK